MLHLVLLESNLAVVELKGPAAPVAKLSFRVAFCQKFCQNFIALDLRGEELLGDADFEG